AVGAILLGTMIAFGPGGIHGVSYWSSPPSVELRAAEPETVPVGIETLDAEAGAVRGEVDEAVQVTAPRLPLGEEPLPALAHGVEERLRSAWNAAPLEEVPADLPRLAATG